MAVQMVPGGLLLIGMLFQRESPRYLITHDRLDEAIANLTYLRQLPADHEFVSTEIREISESVALEKSAIAGSSVWDLMKEIVLVPANRRRYILAIILQCFQQMTGTNAINYYAPSIFASIGLNGTTLTLLATGVYGIVKVITTLIYVFFIIDNVGRRKPLMTGGFIQACCLLYLTVFVAIAHPKAGTPTTAGGYVGLLAIYVRGTFSDRIKTDNLLTILQLYAFGWSFGWSVVPWVVPSEIFPNRIRALCMSSVCALPS
jgi:hypothetical protein